MEILRKLIDMSAWMGYNLGVPQSSLPLCKIDVAQKIVNFL